MRETYNRIIFVIALVALFVSVTLLVSHSLHYVLPCSNERGCLDVARSEHSYLFGLPVAAFGVAFDLFVLAVCLVRPGLSERAWRTATLALWSVSLVAVLASMFYTFVSIHVIRAVCDWCLVHAAATALIWLTSAFEYASVTRMESFPAGNPRGRIPLIGGLLMAGVVSASYAGYLSKYGLPYKTEQVASDEHILHEDSWARGPANAPITIVEFADFECPSCANAASFFDELLTRHPDTVRHVFRHKVLYMVHPGAWDMAEVAEWAGTKGKFWEMYDAFYADPEPGKQGQFGPYAQKAGTAPGEMEAFLRAERKDKNGPRYKAFRRVYRDYQDEQALGVESTPTIYVLVREPGKERPDVFRTTSVAGLTSILDKPAVRGLLGKPAKP